MNSQSAEWLTKSATPDYERPPVTEVVLSAQFEPLQRLKGPQMGLLWGRFRDRFPNLEQHAPLPPFVEKFGANNIEQLNVRFVLTDLMPTPLPWFLSERGD